MRDSWAAHGGQPGSHGRPAPERVTGHAAWKSWLAFQSSEPLMRKGSQVQPETQVSSACPMCSWLRRCMTPTCVLLPASSRTDACDDAWRRHTARWAKAVAVWLGRMGS